MLGLRQQAINRLGRRGLGKQVALHLVAAGKPEQNPLMLRLHPLDHHRQAERAAERYDRLDDHATIGGAAKRTDKAAVDLELVERKALQVAKIGITRAEIIECKAHAERMQVLDALDHLLRIVDQNA